MDKNPGLCYRCHERKNFTREFRHEPVDGGDCSSCHDVHGSELPNMLVASYPQDRYQAFDPAQYDLCFSCHEAGPFSGPDASETAFRSGQLNLHFLHVNPATGEGDKGKKSSSGTTCTNCHEPHSTDQPLLIRKTLDCGGVPCLNLEFKKIGESARCSRGCHTPQTYAP